jgi:hypothetical protein
MENKLLSLFRGTRSFRRNKMGALDAEAVGYGLAVAGGILALAIVVALLFVPTTTFPIIDGELGAFLGGVLFIAGILVHAAGSR